eukprot:TRINITY_DN8090_c1_g1_i1.p1 TRINITY_DN8090_c1_g1~~TRINITY_DN8090_c1_g1_i1.p1  ORF type:complete len:284 (+),score=41.03 TRINITY_DN8090_c1_g1_i1:115-966(+)
MVPDRPAGDGTRIPDRIFPEPDRSLLDAVATYLHTAAALDAPPGTLVTLFDAVAAPAVSVRSYVERLCYTNCSEQCFVLAAIYIRRSGVPLSRRNVHRLLLAGIIVAAKWHDDWSFGNRFYSRVAGVALEEIERLELKLLIDLQMDLWVEEQEYFSTVHEMRRRAAPAVPSLSLFCPAFIASPQNGSPSAGSCQGWSPAGSPRRTRSRCASPASMSPWTPCRSPVQGCSDAGSCGAVEFTPSERDELERTIAVGAALDTDCAPAAHPQRGFREVRTGQAKPVP